MSTSAPIFFALISPAIFVFTFSVPPWNQVTFISGKALATFGLHILSMMSG